MRFTLFFFLACCSLSLSAQKTVKVSTYAELLAAIDDNSVRVIKITSSWIFISEVYKQALSAGGGEEPVGGSLNMVERKDLRIEGASTGTHLVTRDANAVTVHLHLCENITFENIIVGHAPERGSGCSAGVVDVIESKNIALNNCTLFGCGVYGIYALGTEGLRMNNTTVRSCSDGIVLLYDVTNAQFEDCTFTDNEMYFYAFSFQNTKDVVFDNCTVSLNRTDNDKFSVFFKVEEEQRSDILFKDCEIVANSAAYWKSDKGGHLKLENCKVEYNMYGQETKK